MLRECYGVLNLGGSPAVDTALGLVVLFFLLSTVVSSINEAVASVLGWRAKTLEDAVRSLLGDRAAAPRARVPGRVRKSQPDLTSQVFANPRVEQLVRNPESGQRRKSRPSYLEPETFSLALVETLAKARPPTTSPAP